MKRLRLLTYNVRHCRGLDGRVRPERIAQVIAEHEADVVALQELDVGRARSGHVHQPRRIAEHLRMEAHFCAAHVVGDERYGHAILSRHPSRLVSSAGLPTSTPRRRGVERRAAIWVRIHPGDGVAVEVIGVHLGLGAAERREQMRALTTDQWLSHPECTGARIVLGDFNTRPTSPVFAPMAAVLRDARRIAGRRVGRATWPSFAPFLSIDHVLVDEGIEVLEHRVAGGRRAVVASDHRPVVVDVALGSAAASEHATEDPHRESQ